MDAISDLDLSDKKTQLALGGAALAAVFIVAALRGGKDAPGENLSTVQFEWKSDPGGPAYNGTFPQAPPIHTPVPVPADPTNPAPVDPKPTTPKPTTPTVDPFAGLPADAASKWSCPVGSSLAWEIKDGKKTGNIVCRSGAGVQTRVQDKPKTTTPAPAPKPADDGLPYYCNAPSVLARESNGSGNQVCRWPDGRETRVIMKATSKPWGVGGDGPAPANLPGIGQLGGFSPFPEALHAAREITVQAGDSWASLASRYLGDASRWPALRQINPEAADHDLVAGMKLRLP